MSNKRRKRIGSQKIAYNLAIRIRRGAVKAGNRLPGESRTYERDDLTEAYQLHGSKIATANRITDAYWRGA